MIPKNSTPIASWYADHKPWITAESHPFVRVVWVCAGGGTVAGVFTEFPANPLLTSPDLGRLRVLADRHGFPVVVDDSIGTFCNVDLLQPGGADLLASSL